MNDKQSVKSPEGVATLMENLWIRYKAGMKQSANSIYYVDFPEPTAEEREEMRRNRAAREAADMSLDQSHLIDMVNKLGGW